MYRANRGLWLVLILVLASMFVVAGCSCGGDDDDDDSAGPDWSDDDDDSTVDDDDATDDDDDVTDDDDDAVDDDDDDDSTGPVDTFGWILMDTDEQYQISVLDKAVEYGIEHVQFSHSLIMDIDEINDSEPKAQLLQGLAQEAHNRGLEVWVWAHEIYGNQTFVCFDPADPLWESRRQAYRDALTRIPEIDGVVLMYGSADTEPWFAPCFCQWCRDLEPAGSVLDLIHSVPVDRNKFIYDVVGGVVMDEFDKKLRFRTFMHFFEELDWYGEALRTYEDDRLMVMTKDVPQDWVPYYPHNPLIGDVGNRHQIIEMDLGNEYWGVSTLLNGQVDYIHYRWSYDKSVGARGAAARIERGSNHTMGTANEINLFAFTEILQNDATPDEVYRGWFDLRYGIAQQSQAGDVLKEIFRNSHYAMRKMYYTLGMWTLEKGSDVTGSATYPSQLWARNTAFYDADWFPIFWSLTVPTDQTLADLWQESTEAIEIAQNNLTLLQSISGDFAKGADYDELHDMLDLQIDCAEIWRLVTDTVYRYSNKTFGHPDQDPFLEFNAQTLLTMADDMETKWGANVSPGNPGRIRNFVSDLRDKFQVQPSSLEYQQPEIHDLEVEEVVACGSYNITWQSTQPLSSLVEWTTTLPLYEEEGGRVQTLTTNHSYTLNLGQIDEPYAFRVSGHDGQGNLIRTGDFWVGLDCLQ